MARIHPAPFAVQAACADLYGRDRAADERTMAERRWCAGSKPRAPQLPCDVGLFGDDHLQLDLVEMLMDPTNGD
jgi:hypothetical protein